MAPRCDQMQMRYDPQVAPAVVRHDLLAVEPGISQMD
jgi:hypothetical protein